MGLLTSLADPTALLVADASAVINLNASGHAKEIIRALPNRLVVVDVVPAELDVGRARGRRDADLLDELLTAGLVNKVNLNEEGERHFERLVVGPAATTLDDGEAATIAYAVAHNEIAIVDEKKGTKICGACFPEVRLVSSVDIFRHDKVHRSLGEALLGDALFNALCYGRMRVSPHHIEWVVNLIGAERSALCPSLPSSVRTAPKVNWTSGL